MAFMRMKAIAAAAGVAAMTFAAAGAGAVTWDLPLAWPDSNFHTKNAKMFAEEVKKASGGDITINIHSGGSLGYKGPEMLKALRDGLVPIGDYYLSQQVGEEAFLGLESIPFLAKDMDQLLTFHSVWIPEVKKLVESKWNQKILYVVPWPQQYVHMKTEVKTLDDLKGVKIRTYNRTTTDLFNKLGMTSVLLPWGEVVPSLAAGTINAVTTSASSGVDGKFWEFLGWFYPTNHVWGSNVVAVNLGAWNALKPEQRALLEKVAADLEPKFVEVSRAEDTEKGGILQKNGMKLGVVTDEMRAGMVEITKDMKGEMVKEVGGASAEVVSAYEKKIGG